MNRILTLLLTFLFTGSVYAQSVDSAKKLMYYQRYSSASVMLHILLDQDNKNAEAWYLLTRCYLNNDRIESFRDSIVPVPAEIEGSAWIDCARGDFMLKYGNRDSAAYFFDAALKQTKEKDPAILCAIAIAHIRADSGNLQYAIDLLGKAIKRDKRNPVHYLELGNAYRKLLNGTEAYKAYDKSLQLKPSYAEALYRMGKLFATQNNPAMYLKYYQQAVATDPEYAPAWHALYYYYYFRNPGEAITYLKKYISTSDVNQENEYRMADLLYLDKQYPEAISKAKLLMEGTEDSFLDARLYKLLAYSYYAANDTVQALHNMRLYFDRQQDSSIIAKDFEFISDLWAHSPGKSDSAAKYLIQASLRETDSVARTAQYKAIADLYKKIKSFRDEANWRGRYYTSNREASNIDLFNWGIAEYMAGSYKEADSVFNIYTEKYPGQTFGFYWKARSEAAIDTAMNEGLAIGSYKKLIELLVGEGPEHANKKWLIESYGYLAAYTANSENNFTSAIDYLEKVLELDPGNVNANKYLGILKKNITRSPVSKNK